MIQNLHSLPHKYCLEVLNNSARFKVLVWHRKARKTTLDIMELDRWARTVPRTYWYVAPYLNEAKKIVWEDPNMLARIVPPEVWDKRNNTEHYLTYPNGSILYVLGADNPNSLRGPNPFGIVLDEYDFMKPEIWSGIVQPIMTANPDSWCWFSGTYDGRKDLFNKYNFAKDTNNPNWYGSLLKASQSGIIDPVSLEEAKKTTTRDFYLQEYECEAIEGAGAVFKRIDENVWDGNLVIHPQHTYRLGADLAKFQDYTVITPFDLMTFKVGKQDRFNQIDYNLQKAKIEATYLRYQKALTRLDSTGVGEPIYDDLSQRLNHLEGFHFTEQSRRDLLVNLQVLLEQDKIKIPNDEILLNELKSFKYTLTDSGKVRMSVPENTHDDCVMSLALAVWDIPNNPLPLKVTNEAKELLKQFDAHRKPQRLGYFKK